MPFNEDVIRDSRNFYNKEIEPMIKEKFPEYENRIAVGLVGEGSDCFGYYDSISRDHDFGTGVCLWLTDEDYYTIGEELSKAYDEIAYKDSNHGLSARLRQRRGVMSIYEFYSNILCVDCDIENCELTLNKWRVLDHTCLATATNGVVFKDDLRVFTNFREYLLKHLPKEIFKERLAQELHNYAMNLQVNYARCMARKDYVTANICKTNGINAAMQIFFLLNKVYPPYYKWTYRALKELDYNNNFSKLIYDLSLTELNIDVWNDKNYDPNFLNMDDKIVILAEQIATNIVAQLRNNGLTDGRDPYLERYVNEVLAI